MEKLRRYLDEVNVIVDWEKGPIVSSVELSECGPNGLILLLRLMVKVPIRPNQAKLLLIGSGGVLDLTVSTE